MSIDYFKQIPGGVCAPLGFTANGVHCGIRKNRSKPDLALIVSETPASAAAVYTQNRVKGAPLLVTQAHLADGHARAVLCNSGNANTCNADGIEIAEAMCALVERHAGIPADEVIIASTGVIGEPLPLAPIAAGMPALTAGLSGDNGTAASQAILTTDTYAKEAAVEFVLSGKTVRVGGIAKGSGMIHPNMATMLVFLTTDATVSPAVLAAMLKAEANETFNMLSVDGDTSTNDMVSILANGRAGNPEITGPGEDYDAFRAALRDVMVRLCRMLARDGEGATKLLECRVCGAKDKAAARLAARGVISSSLFKAAMFGADANWGRVLCAVGYSGADVDVAAIGVRFRSAAGEVCVCQGGAGVPFSEEQAKKILGESEIFIDITAGCGPGEATAWGCDLTYDYVKINGDYRT